MKGLRKYLAPFAPDISGVSSVLYEMGGILVICDAGGCSGNVCGFDEPRWFTGKSSIFSAGLRDMDAIFGRDEQLVEKLHDACSKLDARFACMIGTPVPAVIGTDYKALGRMAEKKVGIPVITAETTGLRLYDYGEEMAYNRFFEKFAGKAGEVKKGTIGILGATPLDTSDLKIKEKLEAALGQEVICYGCGNGFEEASHAGETERNLVISPAALKAAKGLEERFGTPYEVGYPLMTEEAQKIASGREIAGRKILIVHQQVLANALREELLSLGAEKVTVASYFMLVPERMQAGDVSLSEEDDLIELAEKERYDLVIGDPIFRPMIPEETELYGVLHFAVSGRMYE